MQNNELSLVMPEICRVCGRVFDLWWYLKDLERNKELEIMEKIEHMEFLCDQCRKELGHVQAICLV